MTMPTSPICRARSACFICSPANPSEERTSKVTMNSSSSLHQGLVKSVTKKWRKALRYPATIATTPLTTSAHPLSFWAVDGAEATFELAGCVGATATGPGFGFAGCVGATEAGLGVGVCKPGFCTGEDV